VLRLTVSNNTFSLHNVFKKCAYNDVDSNLKVTVLLKLETLVTKNSMNFKIPKYNIAII